MLAAHPAPAGARARRALHVALLLGTLLRADAAFATAGFAEYSWYFHDGPGRWIEWHHGDICPDGAPRKNCIFLRRSRVGAPQAHSGATAPVAYGGEPRDLYRSTILALLPLVVACLGLARLARRWRQRASEPDRWRAPSTWALGAVTAVAAWSVPHGMAVLLPASSQADGWPVVVGLLLNVPIVLSPLALWWTYRRLFPPRGRRRLGPWTRLLLWPPLLLSGLLAPHALSGPPNLLLLFFPVTVVFNVGLSLLAVAVLSALVNALARIAARRWVT
jgi:hypothetical protein